MRRHPLHPSHLLAGFAVAVLVLAGASPAGADRAEHAPKDEGRSSDHDGDADSDAKTSFTEDDDSNDGGTKSNVADDGDNRHPSGKDRSVENGESGTQGKAESDPDDDGRGPERTNGGPDKANGSGGVDRADQDGNNGCGNDDDFEDDNEGWCGAKPKPTTATTVKPAKSDTKPETKAKPKTETKTKTDTKPDTKPCPDGSMTRPCATATKPNTKPSTKPDTKACPDGSMSRPCTKTDAKPGNGTADIDVDAECRTVTVTSSKDISNVVVSFADGTSQKFEGLRGGTWTRTFDKNVASAAAKSATTVVTGMASSCAAGSAVKTDAKTDDTGDDDGTISPIGGAFGIECPKDADDLDLDDDEDMPFLCALATVAGGNGEVLSGSREQVRGASAEAPAGTVSARSNGQPMLAQLGSGFASVVGGGAAALAFTGLHLTQLVAVALALLLVGAAMHWRARRTS